MSDSVTNRASNNIVSIVIGIIVFGSIWGFFEATLGGFLNMIIFPNKGAIMGGIGMGGSQQQQQPSMQSSFQMPQYQGPWYDTGQGQFYNPQTLQQPPTIWGQ